MGKGAIVVIVMIALFGIFIMGNTVKVPYTAMVTYSVQEPYTVTESYTDQEPYSTKENYQDSVPTSVKNCETKIPTSGSDLFDGVIDILSEREPFQECNNEIVMKAVAKQRDVVKYKTVTKQRQVTKYKTVQKEKAEIRYHTLFQEWFG